MRRLVLPTAQFAVVVLICWVVLSGISGLAQYTYAPNPGGNCNYPLLPVLPGITANQNGQKLYPACYTTQGNESWPAGMLYTNEIGIWDIATEDMGIYSWLTPNLGFDFHISDYGKPYLNGRGSFGWDDGQHRGRDETTLSFLDAPDKHIIQVGHLTVDGGDASGELDAAEYKVGTCEIHSGVGDPNGAVYAPVCSMYLRSDGTPGQVFYVKEGSGASAMGWVAK